MLFNLNKETQKYLYSLHPAFGFGGFGELVYYRTYSRLKPDNTQESWADTVVRVINGIFSIRKAHFINNKLPWKESFHQELAAEMAIAMFNMEWLPPGRGLWAMGTPYIFERGNSSALQNCGAVKTKNLADSAAWTADMLMCGVGIGWDTSWGGTASKPNKCNNRLFEIPDTREGWAESIRLLIFSYTNKTPFPIFGYLKIRQAGKPIRGFGGTASGYEPLKLLHERIENTLDNYCDGIICKTRCIADIMNSIGACVVAGNVRRSAQIAIGSLDDDVFLNLKNYTKYPERAAIGWMSNNSIILKEHNDFERLPAIAERIRDNGEPGLINLINVQKFGRYGELKPDKAELFNPCGEQPLESKECCTLVEVFPTRCDTIEKLMRAIEYATFYASSVTLLSTHCEETNAVMQRNRRIGVSISGITELLQKTGASGTTRILRDGYKRVREINAKLAAEAGIPQSIRITTVKPSGSISLLAGCSPGAHFPTFQYAIRRVRVGVNTPVGNFLVSTGLPYELDSYSDNTYVFSFPIQCNNARPAKEVSAWEQFSLLAMLQREWSDNAVSQTIYFDREKEGRHLEHMLAQFAPLIKSVSLLPHSDNGAYKQMPYEGITKEQFEDIKREMPKIDWRNFSGNDGQDSRYCTNDSCDV